jgi:hypothetical protein
MHDARSSSLQAQAVQTKALNKSCSSHEPFKLGQLPVWLTSSLTGVQHEMSGNMRTRHFYKAPDGQPVHKCQPKPNPTYQAASMSG